MLGSVSEPERSRILFRRAIGELRAPSRDDTCALCLRRFRYFWLFDETNPKTRVLVYRAEPPRAHGPGRSSGCSWPAATCAARLAHRSPPPLAIAVFHTLTIVSARFHIPIEPLMAVWAGAGLTRWAGPRAARSAAAGHHVVGVGLVTAGLAAANSSHASADFGCRGGS